MPIPNPLAHMAETGDIIIKKIKKAAHGHHGGAWKVAYADFVTAMMAFFLLLWLLSTTTEEQKEGIADYFTPTIGLKDSKGIGFEGGETPSPKGESKSDTPTPGTPQPVDVPSEEPKESTAEAKPVDNNTEAENEEEGKQFNQAEQEVKQEFANNPDLQKYQENIVVTQTPEGLKIDMIDDNKNPMFAPGSEELSETGRLVVGKISEIIVRTPNQISITGHTDSTPFAPGAKTTNWELSAGRANGTRRFLATTALEGDRVQKVVGMADRDLLVPAEPNSARNRRISFILLRGTAVANHQGKEPSLRPLLSVPEAPTSAVPAPAPATAPSPAAERKAEKQEEVLREKVPSIFDMPTEEEKKAE